MATTGARPIRLLCRSPLILMVPGLVACAAGKATAEAGEGSPSDSGAEEVAPSLRVPAEWEPQEGIWLQWPQRWEESDEPDFALIVAAIVAHEDLVMLVNDEDTQRSAEAALVEVGGLDEGVLAAGQSIEGFGLRFETVPNDNAWIRDNGPRYVLSEGELRIQDWGFDGWGGAFGEIPYEADDDVPIAIGALTGLPVDTVDIVHERGDLEFNGSDTVILNWTVIGDSNRNPGITEAEVIAAMEEHFGVSRVVLLEGAPTGDRTGGHTDGLARFIDEERVVVADCSENSSCQPGDHDDQIYDESARRLEAAGLSVLRWPFASKVTYKGIPLDTDYMNWLVGNGFVITTGFGDEASDEAAKAQLELWFPGREVYVIEMLESWYNGGGAHCHTNDMPLLEDADPT